MVVSLNSRLESNQGGEEKVEGARTPKTADPVSKMTVKGCRGVPTPTSMKYCVPFLLKMGIWSTCVRCQGLGFEVGGSG